MKKVLAIALGLALGWQGSGAFAWWDEGHMRVATIAWELMTRDARAEAARLIRFNPKYAEWAAEVPPVRGDDTAGDVDRYTFIRAAVWADDIKDYSKDYQYDKFDSSNPKDGQNIGYSDTMAHPYWHFVDTPFASDSAVTIKQPDPVNAETQIKAFIAALPASAHKSDDVRAYDLVWLLHLVGDVHQPLHAITLFTPTLPVPDGDRGGNSEGITNSKGQTMALHAYWDGLFGGYSTVYGTIYDTLTKGKLPPQNDKHWPVNANEGNISDPDVWIQESFGVAKSVAYAAPVGTSGTATLTNPVQLTPQYEAAAYDAALQQNDLAAVRLANLLNAAFP